MLCVDVPQIVAKQSFLAQTVGLGSTTVYTPAASGLYRISAYVETSSGTASVYITWTDDHRAQGTGTSVILGQSNGGNFQTNGDFQVNVIRATTNPIAISSTYSGTGSYDIYVVIELLW